MQLTIFQCVLVNGQKAMVTGFEKDTDGSKLVRVGWTNEMGEYHDQLVKPEEVSIRQDATIIWTSNTQ